MHSSRMRIGRSLTVCWRLLPGGGSVWSGGVCLVRGVSGPGGVCLVRGGFCLVPGGCLPGPGGPAWSGGVSGPGGVSAWSGGGWHPSMH